MKRRIIKRNSEYFGEEMERDAHTDLLRERRKCGSSSCVTFLSLAVGKHHHQGKSRIYAGLRLQRDGGPLRREHVAWWQEQESG